MKKINLKGISEILSEKELKNVVGGSTDYCAGYQPCNNSGDCPGSKLCTHYGVVFLGAVVDRFYC